MQASPQFQELRSVFRKFPIPMSAAFFIWFLVYLLTATFAADWMATPVGGGFNYGIIFGLLQFFTTFLITWIYVKFANKNIEPRTAAIRQEMEG